MQTTTVNCKQKQSIYRLSHLFLQEKKPSSVVVLQQSFRDSINNEIEPTFETAVLHLPKLILKDCRARIYSLKIKMTLHMKYIYM